MVFAALLFFLLTRFACQYRRWLAAGRGLIRHEHILRTPTEVANARNYVLGNYARHYEQTRGWPLAATYVDESAGISVELTAAPHTWLLKEGWRRAAHSPHRPPKRSNA